MRVEIPGDPISVAYGYGITGVFLSVFDKRLEYDPISSREVNAVAESIGVGDGGGSYFDLHTGSHGFGIKVDHDTMATYLKRFGVSEEKISELPLTLTGVGYWTSVKPGTSTKKVGSSKICTNCRVKSRSCKDCKECHKLVPYCSKECQKKDWRIHKLFCGLHEQEVSNGVKLSSKSVRAFLFPEDAEMPKLIHLPLVRVGADQGDITSSSFYLKLNLEEFIQGPTDSIRSDFFTDESIRSLPKAYHVICKDGFGSDGSKMNLCVLKLFQKYEKIHGGCSQEPCDPHWRNNIIVVKAEPVVAGWGSTQLDTICEDISIADATEVVKFLYTHHRKV